MIKMVIKKSYAALDKVTGILIERLEKKKTEVKEKEVKLREKIDVEYDKLLAKQNKTTVETIFKVKKIDDEITEFKTLLD